MACLRAALCTGRAAPFDSAQGRPFDAAQGMPFDSAQGRPFDAAQGMPFDAAQGMLAAWGAPGEPGPVPPLRRVCVFCGSHPGNRPSYVRGAVALGRALAARGIGLVYGGGSVGLMGAAADAALEGRVEVIGVIPRRLASKEIAHAGLTELRVVKTMHERKATMEALSDAFVALPGGFGTFEELFEIVTWLQLGLHQKPVGLLNVDGYYDPLLEMVRRGVDEGFIGAAYARALVHTGDPETLVRALVESPPPPPSPKWIDLEQT